MRSGVENMGSQKMLVLGLVIVLIVGGFGVPLGSSRGTKLAIEETEKLNDLFAGGSGTESDPYEISNVTQLQNMNEDLDAHYELVNDIDASPSKNWNNGKGFLPIGTANNSFTGALDGQGYKISDLYIDRPNSNEIGLFGSLGKDASLDNIALVDANVTGNNLVGGLVGNNAGTVRNSYVTGNVSGNNRVGSLVGINGHGTIKNSYVTGVVSGNNRVGGLVGDNSLGPVSNSYATVDVKGNNSVGGLVGQNYGETINNSYATGNVSGNKEVGALVGNNGEGGLIGVGEGTVSNSYATGDVSGYEFVGGLVGMNFWGATVTNSYATGDVGGKSKVGALVGDNNQGTVNNSYATGDVSGKSKVGGLVGYNSVGPVINSYATGDVSGNSSVGGLIGTNDGKVSNSHYNIDEVLINGEHRITIGGLFDSQYQDWMSSNKTLKIEEYSSTLVLAGDHYEISGVEGLKDLLGFADDEEYKFTLVNNLDLSEESGLYVPYLAADFDGNGHTIKDLNLDWSVGSERGFIGYLAEYGSVTDIALVDANVKGHLSIGGLVGENGGTVSNSYVTGDINGNTSVGGLVGWNAYEGTITNSYATGDVSGYEFVGGLVGGNNIHGKITDTYAMGDVSGYEFVGGLVGYNAGTVNNSYATGNVSGNNYVGGLVGDNDETISNSFWDVTTTGQSLSAGGTGKTTAEMKDIDTFTDTSTEGLEQAWDFVGKPNDDSGYYDIWKIDENGTINNGYPYLTTFPPTAVAKADETTVEIGETVRFDASNSTDNMGIKSYSWELSNGTTVYGETITHSYDSPGEYTVTLTVTDEAGNKDTDTLTVTVEDRTEPTAVISADKTKIEVDENISLDAFNSTDNVGIVSYEWDLDNGETKTGKRLNYSYDSAGKYTVTLTVTDEAGNTATDTIQITVEESDDNGRIPGFTAIVLIIAISFVALFKHHSKQN